jgi:hypothetical protein
MELLGVFKILKTTFTKLDNSKISNIWIMDRNRVLNLEIK